MELVMKDKQALIPVNLDKKLQQLSRIFSYQLPEGKGVGRKDSPLLPAEGSHLHYSKEKRSILVCQKRPGFF